MRENLSSGSPTSFYTNRGVQPQKIARDLKFGIYKVEDSENKGDDQLHSYCLNRLNEAVLMHTNNLCFEEKKYIYEFFN